MIVIQLKALYESTVEDRCSKWAKVLFARLASRFSQFAALSAYRFVSKYLTGPNRFQLSESSSSSL